MFRLDGDPWWAVISWQLRAARKFVASFGKRVWTIDDYPIAIRHRERSPDLGPRFVHHPWTVQIINWWHMRGDGLPLELALEDLRSKLSDHEPTELPRPGTGRRLEISFAPQQKIVELEHVAVQFFPVVLEMQYEDCLITDESSLWDFHGNDTNDEYHRRIFQHYGIDVSDIESGNLVEILERIENR